MADIKRVTGADDPYKMLAHTIVVKYPEEEVDRILRKIKAIKQHIRRETVEADFYGDFIDCIMVGLIKSGKRRTVNKTLYGTADLFFNYLDVPRLRAEIINYCKFYNKNIAQIKKT